MSAPESNEDFDERLRKLGWIIEEKTSSSSAKRARINYLFYPPGVKDLPPKERRLRYAKDFREGKVNPGDVGVYFNSRSAAKMWLGELDPNYAEAGPSRAKRSRTSAKRRPQGSSDAPSYTKRQVQNFRIQAALRRQGDNMKLFMRYQMIHSAYRNASRKGEFVSDVFNVPTGMWSIKLRGKTIDTLSVVKDENRWRDLELYVKTSTMPGAGWGLFTKSFIAKGKNLTKLADFGDVVAVEVDNFYDYKAQSDAEEQQAKVNKVLFDSVSTREEKNAAWELNAALAETKQLLKNEKTKILRSLREKSTRVLKNLWRHTVDAWNDLMLRENKNEELLDADNIRTHPYAVKGNDFWGEKSVQRFYYDPFMHPWGFMNDPGPVANAETSAAGNKRARGNVDTKIMYKGTDRECVVFYALEDIRPGEEMLWSYGTNYNWEQVKLPVEVASESNADRNGSSSSGGGAGDANKSSTLEELLKDIDANSANKSSDAKSMPEDAHPLDFSSDDYDSIDEKDFDENLLDSGLLDLGSVDGFYGGLADEFATRLRF